MEVARAASSPPRGPIRPAPSRESCRPRPRKAIRPRQPKVGHPAGEPKTQKNRKLDDVDPRAWLADALTRIVNGQSRQRDRRPPTLGLRHRLAAPRRGLKTTLTAEPPLLTAMARARLTTKGTR